MMRMHASFEGTWMPCLILFFHLVVFPSCSSVQESGTGRVQNKRGKDVAARADEAFQDRSYRKARKLYKRALNSSDSVRARERLKSIRYLIGPEGKGVEGDPLYQDTLFQEKEGYAARSTLDTVLRYEQHIDTLYHRAKALSKRGQPEAALHHYLLCFDKLKEHKKVLGRPWSEIPDTLDELNKEILRNSLQGSFRKEIPSWILNDPDVPWISGFAYYIPLEGKKPKRMEERVGPGIHRFIKGSEKIVKELHEDVLEGPTQATRTSAGGDLIWDWFKDQEAFKKETILDSCFYNGRRKIPSHNSPLGLGARTEIMFDQANGGFRTRLSQLVVLQRNDDPCARHEDRPFRFYPMYGIPYLRPYKVYPHKAHPFHKASVHWGVINTPAFGIHERSNGRTKVKWDEGKLEPIDQGDRARLAHALFRAERKGDVHFFRTQALERSFSPKELSAKEVDGFIFRQVLYRSAKDDRFYTRLTKICAVHQKESEKGYPIGHEKLFWIAGNEHRSRNCRAWN